MNETFPTSGQEPGAGSGRGSLRDRLIFAVAVLGILVVVHLWIQQGRGFDQGCWGFNPPDAAAAQTFDCEAVVSSSAGTILGIPNVIAGLGFYVLVAGLTLAVVGLRSGAAHLSRYARAVLVACGFAYSLYLVYYQATSVGAYCALCLTSAGLVTVLSVLVAVDLASLVRRDRASGGLRAATLHHRMRELRFAGVLTVFLVVLTGADVTYFSHLERREVVAECGFDPEYPAVANYGEFIDPGDPAEGDTSARVTVIEFFDPNCPHCKALHPIMQEVVREHSDDAVFYFKPYPIWDISLRQVAALYAAEQTGDFFALMDGQFAAQKPGGMTEADLQSVAESAGMSGPALLQRIDQGLYQTVLQDRERILQAGVNSVPRLWIDGRTVPGDSRTADCIGKLIEQETAAQRN